MAKVPDIGQAAPDFTLPGVVLAHGGATRHEYTLSHLRGKPVGILLELPGQARLAEPGLSDDRHERQSGSWLQ